MTRTPGSTRHSVPAAMIASYAAASLSGSWRGDPSSAAMSATTSSAPSALTATLELRSGRARCRRSASTASTRRSGACASEHAEVVGRVEAVGLARLRRQVEHDHDAAAGLARAARRSSGTSRCGITEVNHDPGPSTTQSAARTAATRLGAGRRVVRVERDRRRSCPSRGRHLDLAADGGHARRVAGVERRGPGGDVQRCQRHRQHPALGAEQPADPVEARDVVAEQLPQRRRSAGCRRRGRASRRRRRTGAAAPRPRCGPTRRRRTARPAPSAGRRAAARRARSRSRPDEPPLSATVTTAVRSSTTWRSADSDGVQAVPAAEGDHGRARSVAATLTPARGRGGRGRTS